MSKLDKQIERFKSKPKDFTYDEAKQILNNLGFYENNKGKTSGARVEYANFNKQKIQLHKPHHGRILKPYQVNILLKELIRFEVI